MRIIFFILLLPIFIYSNSLKNSTSPYLLQHKDNPVNWMEWSKKAFNKAKREKKFIFLSIGYSTCHWCHVMAKESFSQKDLAKILNKNFVSIKVDRERLSDIDSYYQTGYRVVNGRGGGWPLTVILLPNKKPIFFGTYIPKDALIDVLKQVISMPKEKLYKIGDRLDIAVKKAVNSKLPLKKIPNNLVKKALNGYKAIFDNKYKGFSAAPKFPQASSIDALLNIYLISGEKSALTMATEILDAMAKGGIYDQIEGGFFRYSVDAKWQIPHFEKMLYTNAELISVYSKAYKITKKRLYANVVKKSIANIEKYFGKAGLYYSASNADSKNEDGIEQEGYYFVYDYDSTLRYLVKNGVSKERAKKALHYFGIEPMGNFEGGDYSNATLNGKIGKYLKVKGLLKKLRAKKEYPFIDKKINSAWNALYIKALFDAASVDKKYEKIALNSLDKLLKLIYKGGVIYHQTLLPNKPIQKGLLEDYSFVADSIFSAYEATLSDRYLKLFNKIVKDAINRFYKKSQWYASSNKNFRVKASFEDGGYKSAVAKMVENLLKNIASNGEYNQIKIVKTTLKRGAINLYNSPQYYPTLLNSTLMYKEGLYVIKGKKEPLLSSKISVKYPYIYKKAENYTLFQICGLQSCYKSFKDITKLNTVLGELIKLKLFE